MKSLKRHRVVRLILVIILLLSIAGGFIYFFLNPFRGSTPTWSTQNISLDQTFTRKEAIEDLDYLLQQYSSVDYQFKDGVLDAFQKQYKTEKENMPEEPTLINIWQAAGRIVSTLNTGHNGVYSRFDGDCYYNAAYSMGNGIVSIAINGEYYEVSDINGVPIRQILENAASLLSYENDIYLDYLTLSNLQSLSGISLLTGKYSEEYTVTYLDDNVPIKINIDPYQPEESNIQPEDFISYRIDKDHNAAILTLKKCNYNKHYKKILKDFFTEVRDNDITNIAVDLRDNGGGSSLVANEFIRYLDVKKIKDYTSYYRLKFLHLKSPFHSIAGNKEKDLIYHGKVYVLTSISTYSSAMNFSVLLQDNGLAQVIGEPCGNQPSQYGEVVTFRMPHSKLYFTCSIAYFERPNKALTEEPNQTPDFLTAANEAEDKLYEIIIQGIDK